MKYIDAEKLKAEIQRYKNKADERLKIKGRTFGEEQKDLALQNLCGNLLYFISSLQQDETQLDKILCTQVWWEEQGWIMIPPDATIEGIDSLLKQVRKKLQQEQSKEQLIQVKCISPYDESWEKDKIYTCNVWHHGSLNIDFWDVYYDYGNKPNYVQFSSIEMLNKEFAIIQQEQPVLPGIEESGIPGKDYIPVEWVDACEKYGKWKIVKQEQPEVDIEKEIEEHAIYMPHGEIASDNEIIEDMEWARKEFRHFYALGVLKASWYA